MVASTVELLNPMIDDDGVEETAEYNHEIEGDGNSVPVGLTEEDIEEFVVPVVGGCERDDCGGYIPRCPARLKPIIGMRFESLDEGIRHYRDYGRACGFVARLGTQRNIRSGIVALKYIVCAKEGDKYVRDLNEDGEFIQYNKRRCVTTRTGCKAMISLKLENGTGYVVSKFTETHNHPFFTIEDFQYLRSNRNLTEANKQFLINCQKASIGPTMAHNLCSALAGGPEYVGATITDFRNFQRDLKVYITEFDVQMVINEFLNEQSFDCDFYFEYAHDECHRLTRLFWADGVSRWNYVKYGDCLSFDSTYGTNRYSMVFCPFTGVDNNDRSVTFGAGLISKEDTESYVWLFECFMRAMHQKHPLCIVTDQDVAMKNAIGHILPESRHRLCMWHIMRKLPEKVGSLVPYNSDFWKRFRAIVWSGSIEIEEFESRWKSIVRDYELEGSNFLTTMYELRSSWVPAYFKGQPMAILLRTTSRSESANNTFSFNTTKILILVEFMWRFNAVVKNQRRQQMKLRTQYSADAMPTTGFATYMEMHAWNMYTRELYYKVRSNLMDGVLVCGVDDIIKEAGETTYKIKDHLDKIFDVKMNKETKHCVCVCNKYEGEGLLCMHIFCALKADNVREIPRSMLKERWCRDTPESMEVGPLNLTGNATAKTDNLLNIEIWTTLQTILGNRATNSSHREELLTMLKQYPLANLNIVAGSSRSAPISIETMSGIPKPPVVTVNISNVCKNKGSGRRMQSERERAIEQRGTGNKRKCSYCFIEGHNSRSCEVRKRDEANKNRSTVEPA